MSLNNGYLETRMSKALKDHMLGTFWWGLGTLSFLVLCIQTSRFNVRYVPLTLGNLLRTHNIDVYHVKSVSEPFEIKLLVTQKITLQTCQSFAFEIPSKILVIHCVFFLCVQVWRFDLRYIPLTLKIWSLAIYTSFYRESENLSCHVWPFIIPKPCWKNKLLKYSVLMDKFWMLV